MRKILCIILVISLLSYNVCTYAEANIGTENQKLEELQEEAGELNQQIYENLEQLELVEEELSENLLQVQEIDSKIQASEVELSKLNEDVNKLNEEIQNKQKELNSKEVQYNKINKQAEKVLVAMYEGGDVQYLDVLLGSKNIVDFVSNYFLISEMLEYNIKLIEEAASQKQEIEDIVRNLATQKEEIITKKKEYQKTNQILENTKTSKQYYMSKLTEEEKQIQEKMQEYQNEMAAIEIEIRKLSGLQSFGENYIGGDMIWPVPGYTTITSQYGMRTHPITGLYKLHTGTDIGAPIGANFVASATGVVTKAEYNKYYGNMVIIDHGGGVQTLYAHGSEIVAKLGDLVSAGDIILKVGSTGYSTGPHAHFEIRINGKTLNPLHHVTPQ